MTITEDWAFLAAKQEDPIYIETKLEEETYPDEEEGGAELEGGTVVAKGSHVVPKGVAVEELKNYMGHKDLQNKCPQEVRDLLTQKEAFDIFDKFVDSIVKDRTTRKDLLGKWRDAQFISVLDQFRDDFANKGIRVALCKRRSGSGTHRWLEFIDVDQLDASTYVPQFDVANFSGQVIKTYFTKLEFPNGVAVEEFKQWGGRKKLKERIPIHVEKLLQEHDLMKEYDQLIDHCIEAGCGGRAKAWNNDKLKEIMATYQPIFAAKGIDAFIGHKREWVSHGHGAHQENFRWIEFVDRVKQPNYHPQREAESKCQTCVIS